MKTEALVALRYQLLFLDPHADRKDQLVAVEPMFQSPSAIDILTRTMKFENKEALVVIGLPQKIEELIKTIERLDLTDWLDLDIPTRKAKIIEMAKAEGLEAKTDGLRPQAPGDELVLGDEIELQQTTAMAKAPYPPKLPDGREEMWDAVGRAPETKNEMKKWARPEQRYAVQCLYYQEACLRANLVPWATTTFRDLRDQVHSTRSALIIREEDAEAALQYVEKHLLDQGLIGRIRAPKMGAVGLHASQNHYEIEHVRYWTGVADWKKLETFVIREIGKKYIFRQTKNLLTHDIHGPQGREVQHNPVVRTRIELAPEDGAVRVSVVQVLTRHQASMLTQEETDVNITKVLKDYVTRWYKTGKFPDLGDR